MQAARKVDRPRTVDSPVNIAPKPSVAENEPKYPPLDIRIWFFYWFNGIQCPC